MELTIVSIETGPYEFKILCHFIYNGPKTAHTMLYYLKDIEKIATETKDEDEGKKQKIKFSFVNCIPVDRMLTVMPYLMISFIRSSSIVARKVSLGCSISGTTSSRIFATLQITMKSFCV